MNEELYFCGKGDVWGLLHARLCFVMEPGLTLVAQIEEDAFKSLKSYRKAPH